MTNNPNKREDRVNLAEWSAIIKGGDIIIYTVMSN